MVLGLITGIRVRIITFGLVGLSLCGFEPALLASPSGAIESPMVTNFTKAEYRADNQNWAVTEDPDGNVFFANNRGLLEFDGVSWKLYPLPKGNVIRCVAIGPDKKIYTSGYRELGYWERLPSGGLRYTSLKGLAEHDFIPNVEFWQIFAVGDRVYFHSFMQIMVWDGKKMTSIKLPSFSNSMSIVGDKIVIDLADGLYSVENGLLVPYLTGSFFHKSQVKFVFKDEFQHLIIGTFSDGIFSYDGVRFNPFNSELNNYFIRNKVNQAARTINGNLIVGTHLDGIVALNKFGTLQFKLNSQNGLQNNTVLGLAVDRNQNIWQALDKGIGFVSFRAKESLSLHPVKDIGAVYSAALYEGNLYLATNQGLYSKRVGESDDQFRLIPESEGQVWCLYIFKGKLFAGLSYGTYQVSDRSLKRIADVHGVFAITPDVKRPGFLFQSTYSELVSIDFTGSEPHWSKNMKNFNDLIQYIESDLYGNLWAGHMHRGIFRLKLSESRDEVIQTTYYGEKSPFKKDGGIHPFKIEDRIVFTTGEELFTYDELKDSIVVFRELNKRLGALARAHRIVAAPNHHYWFLSDESIALLQIQNNEVKRVKIYPISLFNGLLIENFEQIIPVSDLEAILCLENGYALLNAAVPTTSSLLQDRIPRLKEFITTDRSGNSDTLAANSTAYTLTNSRNNAQLKFSFPLVTSEKILFKANLEGIDPGWRTPVTYPIFKFDRLPEGSYTLQVKAIDQWGAESKTASIKLTILPPWYLTLWARFGYVLIASGLLWWFRRRIILLTRQKEQRKRAAKERELITLRNEKLQDEISFKSQELANSTMSIIKKNEFLIELKKELKLQKNQLDSRFPDKYYLRLVKKIDDNIASHDDWKTFETNFERAHEEFMKKMKANFHKLTPGDLRLCAYLRMNLSSKEIAPLLGISVRGLENHRYRLRKKMGLDVDANLNEVMMNMN